MTGQDWQNEVQFVATFVSRLDATNGMAADRIAEDKAHVALLTFSSTTAVNFGYDYSYDASALVQFVRNSVPYIGNEANEGLTNLAGALEKVVALNKVPGIAGYRGVAPVVVIVTDGNPTDSIEKLTAHVNTIQRQGEYGTEIYAIMVGKRINTETLQRISSLGVHIMTPRGFIELLDDRFLSALVSNVVCAGDTTNEDLAGVVDESSNTCKSKCESSTRKRVGRTMHKTSRQRKPDPGRRKRVVVTPTLHPMLQNCF